MLPGVRALPDLGRNIKCGNSLVGADFYAQGELTASGARRINAFDWNSEFPHILSVEGGFDCVIGNPPYVRQETLGAAFKDYARKNFKVYHGAADLYAYFIERGLSLLKPAGRFSFIVANKWLRANYGAPLRDFLRKRNLLEIVDFGDLPVFKGATTYPCILTVGGGARRASFAAAKADDLDFDDLEEHIASRRFTVAQNKLAPQGWALINKDAQELIEKLRAQNTPLSEYVGDQIYRGVLTGLNEAFVIDDDTRQSLIAADANSANLIKPFVRGRDIKRYQTPQNSGGYLIFARHGVEIKNYPAILAHLEKYKRRLRPRPATRSADNWPGRKPGRYKWYEIQDAVDYYAEFEKQKIVLPDISATMNFAIDRNGFYCANTAYIIPVPADSDDGEYLLAVLNSKVAEFFYRNLAAVYRGGYLRFFAQYLAQIPIPRLNSKSRQDQTRRKQIIAVARKITTLQQALQTANTPHERTLLSRQIAAHDKTLNAQITRLYNLSPAEAALIAAPNETPPPRR
jgi:hypothetical protein